MSTVCKELTSFLINPSSKVNPQENCIFFIIIMVLHCVPLASQPNWEPAHNLQYNMNIVAKLQLNEGDFSLNEKDLVAGFVENECRGVISPSPSFDGLLFLTIGSNQIKEETIVFMAYLADLDSIVILDEILEFENQLMVGTAGEPFLFTFGSEPLTFNLEILCDPVEGGEVSGGGSYTKGSEVLICAEPIAGWKFINWVKESAFISNETCFTYTMPQSNSILHAVFMEEHVESYAINFDIKDQKDILIENAVISLNGIYFPENHYKVENLQKGDYSFTISKNGFMPFEGEFEIIDRDIEMTVVLDNVEIPSSDWIPAPNMQYNMNIISVLQLTDGMFSLNENDLIAGFVGAECRGIISPMASLDGLLFLTIGSNQIQGETINFKAHLADSDSVVILDQLVEFENQSIIGTIADPFIFTYKIEEKRLFVEIAANPEEGGIVHGAGEYVMGSEVEINALPNKGYRFVNWTENDVEVSTEEEYSFEMQDRDVALIANFELIGFEVSVTVNPQGSGTVTGSGIYSIGDQVILEVSSNKGYSFVNWTENDIVISTEAEYSFEMPDRDVALTSNLIEVFTVDFILNGEDNSVLGNAEILITKDGILVATLITGSDGKAKTELPEGDYHYTVSLDEYEKLTGSITIVDQDEEIVLILLYVGIDNVGKIQSQLKVYPNPGNGMFYIEYVESENNSFTVEITNLTGSIIYVKKFNIDDFKFALNLQHLNRGVYFLRIMDSVKPEIIKIIIQ